MRNIGTFIRIGVAFAIIIGVIFWATNTIRPRTYSGTEMMFAVGGGTVQVTNPSEQATTVQLIGTGSRTFRVTSTVEGLSGSSTREGSTRTHIFEFDLMPGINEFTVSGGNDVNFVGGAGAELQATVNPIRSESQRTILIVAGLVILGALYYASSATQHRWFNTLRRKPAVVTPEADPDNPVGGQGAPIRAYGDNTGKGQ